MSRFVDPGLKALGEAIWFAAVGIVNTHEQLIAAVQVGLIKKSQAITFYWHIGGPGSYQSWRAYSPYEDLNPNGNWSEGGCKIFAGIDKNDKSEALAFVIEMTGLHEWIQNRHKNWVPVVVEKVFPLRENTK